MALKVLLRRNIEGVGEVGDIVRVKPGYARNFLLPRGYAAIVTPDALAQIAKDKVVEARRLAQVKEHNDLLVKQLEGMKLTIEVRAGDDGHLYGSVGVKQILAAFEADGYRFEARQIRFDPVRELGEYMIPVHISGDHVVEVKLWVVRDAIDAMNAAEAFPDQGIIEDDYDDGDVADGGEAAEGEATETAEAEATQAEGEAAAR